MAASSGIGQDGAFYEQFQALLNESIPDCSPAEVQGMLTGLVCAGETDDQFNSWGALLVENDPKNPAHERNRSHQANLLDFLMESGNRVCHSRVSNLRFLSQIFYEMILKL